MSSCPPCRKGARTAIPRSACNGASGTSTNAQALLHAPPKPNGGQQGSGRTVEAKSHAPNIDLASLVHFKKTGPTPLLKEIQLAPDDAEKSQAQLSPSAPAAAKRPKTKRKYTKKSGQGTDNTAKKTKKTLQTRETQYQNKKNHHGKHFRGKWSPGPTIGGEIPRKKQAQQ